jgi:membrane-bound lytic murein transglycosylase A
VRRFFASHFTPYQVVNEDGSTQGIITGYYEPLLRGSRVASDRYRYPLYGVPDDLLTVELSEVYPELKHLRLRGRVEGRRVIPYYPRAEIEGGRAPLGGRAIVWVDDPLDLYFLQVHRSRARAGSSSTPGRRSGSGTPTRTASATRRSAGC